jgi:hypothetical protein
VSMGQRPPSIAKIHAKREEALAKRLPRFSRRAGKTEVLLSKRTEERARDY